MTTTQETSETVDTLTEGRVVQLRAIPHRTQIEQNELAFLEEYLTWQNGPGRNAFEAAQARQRAQRVKLARAKESPADLLGSVTADKIV